MKDIIEFPVVGTAFLVGAVFTAQLLQEGAILNLIAEPENKFDKNAIKVLAFSNSEHIGYIPNKGMSCSHCWTHISLKDTGCPNCGAGWDFVIEGGLATRLIMTQALTKDFACYVKSINKEDRFSPIKAKLVLE